MAVAALLAAVALAAASAPATERPAAPRRLEFPAEAGIPEVPVENPHDHRGAPYCAWCHEGRDPAVKGDPVALCARCHPPAIMKHPYGRPAKQVPAGLPLGAGDRIVCHTCHDPHDVRAHRKGLRLDYQSLCAECHAGHGRKASAAPARPSPRPPGLPHPRSAAPGEQ